MAVSYVLFGIVTYLCVLLAVPTRAMRRFPVFFLRRPLSPGLDYDDVTIAVPKILVGLFSMAAIGVWWWACVAMPAGIRSAEFDQNFRYLGGSFLGLLLLLIGLTIRDNNRNPSDRPDDGFADLSRPFLLGATASFTVLAWFLATNGPLPLEGAEELVSVSPRTAWENVSDSSLIAPDRADEIGSNRLRVNYLMEPKGRCNHHGDIRVVETSSSITISVEVVRFAANEHFKEMGMADGCWNPSSQAAEHVNPSVVEHRYQEITLDSPVGDRAIVLGN